MEKCITKEMFPEFLSSCWEAGICAEFDPASRRVWIKANGIYESVLVVEEISASDLVELVKAKIAAKGVEED
jgi:hypothetical protein